MSVIERLAWKDGAIAALEWIAAGRPHKEKPFGYDTEAEAKRGADGIVPDDVLITEDDLRKLVLMKG